jgi:uncharacterized protein YfaS (alpha-2-macroglobulin family)
LKGNIFKANLDVNWLTGATAKNLKADVNLEMRQMKDPFEKYKDYRFFDEAQTFYPTEKELFNGTLDNLGNVKTNMTVGNFTTAPGMLEAVFVTRVFEPGGDISIDRSSRPYAPFPYFVGMKTPQPTNSPWL